MSNPAGIQQIGRSEPLPGLVDALVLANDGQQTRVYAGAGDHVLALALGADGEMTVESAVVVPGVVRALDEVTLYAGGIVPREEMELESGFIAAFEVQQPAALNLRQWQDVRNPVNALALHNGALYFSGDYGWSGVRLAVMDVDGFPLPFAGNVGSAIFSPDRSQIAFYHPPGRSNEGTLVIAGTAGPTTLLLGALDGSVREIGRLSETLDSYAFSEAGTYVAEAFGFQFAIPSGYAVADYGVPDALLGVSLHERVILADERIFPKPEIFVTVHQNEEGLSVAESFAAHTAEEITDSYPVFVNPRNVRAERIAGRAALSFEDMTWSHGFVTLVEGDGVIVKIGYVPFAYPGLADAFEHVRQSLTFMAE